MSIVALVAVGAPVAICSSKEVGPSPSVLSKITFSLVIESKLKKKEMKTISFFPFYVIYINSLEWKVIFCNISCRAPT